MIHPRAFRKSPRAQPFVTGEGHTCCKTSAHTCSFHALVCPPEVSLYSKLTALWGPHSRYFNFKITTYQQKGSGISHAEDTWYSMTVAEKETLSMSLNLILEIIWPILRE